MKYFISYIVGLFWREQGGLPKLAHEWLERARKATGLGCSLWLGVAAVVRVPIVGRGFM